ncbi:MAG: hydrogenase expression/formation protein HypE [Candidatus Thermoplasmatota archaeon]
MNDDVVTLAEGSGGREMHELIRSYGFSYRGKWKNYDTDAASFDLDMSRSLVFTTDSFIVDPIFFPGGDIGHLAFCGTINDLAVLGAQPIGVSLGIVLEEGFPKKDLKKIISTIKRLSGKTKIPVVTGDTKVMQKGTIDKIVINSAGVGLVKKKEMLIKKINPGDKIIISGGLGEHAVALLSKRFQYKTTIVSDSKPIFEEIRSVLPLIKVAKDPTRGGLASSLHEVAQRYKVGMVLDEERIPVKPGVKKVSELLGVNVYELACEGRFVCVASEKNASRVEKKLQDFNSDAAICGRITKGSHIIIQSILGTRILPMPSGRIVPRIC